MNIVSIIRKLRNEKGYSQEYMAYRLGITQSTYCKIEKDDRKINFENITKIAAILDTESHRLIVFGLEN